MNTDTTKLTAFLFGAICALSFAFAFYIVLGRQAVNAAAAHAPENPASRPSDIAEACMAFWLGAKPQVVFQEWHEICGKTGSRTR